MKKILILFLLQLITGFWVFGNGLKIPDTFLKECKKHKLSINPIDTTYRIIQAPGNRYGYEILINGNAIIRQLNIPGKSGTNGFKKIADAEKVAALVLKKLRMGIMPPSIEEYELNILKVNY